MKKIIKYGQYILVLICIVTFFYILKDFNSSNLKQLIKNINYFWVFITIITAVIISLIKVIRLKVICQQFNYNPDNKTVYKSQIISILLAFLTPGRVGEVSKVHLLSQGNKEFYKLTANIMFLEIINDFLCITLISLFFFYFVMNNILLAGVTFALLIIVLLIIGFIAKGNKLIEKLPDSVKEFFQYISNNNIKLFYKWYLIFPLTALAWLLDGFFQYFILKSVANNSNGFILAGISAISSIISVVSILPMGLGVNDLSSLFLYKTFLNLKTEYVLYLVNATRLFWVITLGVLALPFISTLNKSLIKNK